MSINKLRFLTGEIRDVLVGRPALDDLELSPDLPRWHPFNRQMYFGARIMLPGHLLASKGDRIAMHSSVESRYVFLDDDVIDYMAKLHPRWKLRGMFQDKFIERKVAERWLPQEIAWRKKHMFRAPMDSWIKEEGKNAMDENRNSANGSPSSSSSKLHSSTRWIDQVLSPESIQKAGYFDPVAVATAREKLARPGRGLSRTSMEMGLTAVIATQLWHHIYLGGQLCELPTRY
jgi:asparagine synthase (glutamine-hydrolysing)